jgi:hypothetical protein
MAIHDAPLGHALADRLVVIEKGVVALDLATKTAGLDQFLNRYRDITEER